MANELCANGFANPDINGTYTLYSIDLWTNGTYWIYKDSWWWMISKSPTFNYHPEYLTAIKAYVPGSWANGEYFDIGPWVNGNYTLGSHMGYVDLGICDESSSSSSM